MRGHQDGSAHIRSARFGTGADDMAPAARHTTILDRGARKRSRRRATLGHRLGQTLAEASERASVGSMAPGLARRSRRLRSCGLLAAAMALVSQLALGTAPPSDDLAQARLAALEAAGLLCHETGADRGTPAHHAHGADHALCPVCCGLALPSVTLASAPHLPLPPLLPRSRARPTPPARAPLPSSPAAAYPRGPPNLA